MRIEHLPQGWRIVIPETDHNSEFVYDMPIVSDGPEHIRAEQLRLARKLAIRAFSMENFFKAWRKPSDFMEWAQKNRVGDWNDWFHVDMDLMREDAWALQREYWDWHFETFGWNAI